MSVGSVEGSEDDSDCMNSSKVGSSLKFSSLKVSWLKVQYQINTTRTTIDFLIILHYLSYKTNISNVIKNHIR